MFNYLRDYQNGAIGLLPSSSNGALASVAATALGSVGVGNGTVSNGNQGSAVGVAGYEQPYRGVRDIMHADRADGGVPVGPFEYECLVALLQTVEKLHDVQVRLASAREGGRQSGVRVVDGVHVMRVSSHKTHKPHAAGPLARCSNKNAQVTTWRRRRGVCRTARVSLPSPLRARRAHRRLQPESALLGTLHLPCITCHAHSCPQR